MESLSVSGTNAETTPPNRTGSRSAIDANLPAEFYVASQLLRQGHMVTITLGHTKEVDLVVQTKRGNLYTIDVKGLKNKTNWPIKIKRAKSNHFYVFVSYLDRFDDIAVQPQVFVVPSRRARGLLSKWARAKQEVTTMNYRRLKGSVYENAWNQIR